MGKLARLVDGIKARLSRKEEEEEEAAATCSDKVDKTESMRVELRSRRTQELIIAKNLAAADSIGRHGVGGKKNKKRFFAF